jgi:hypothetical protein
MAEKNGNRIFSASSPLIYHILSKSKSSVIHPVPRRDNAVDQGAGAYCIRARYEKLRGVCSTPPYRSGINCRFPLTEHYSGSGIFFSAVFYSPQKI